MKSSRVTLLTFLFALFALSLPAFAQDATPEGTAQIAQRTIIADDGIAAVSIPLDWLVTNSPSSDSVISIKLANNQEAMDKELFNRDDVFKPGEVHIEFELIELAELVKSLPDSSLTTNSTPLEIIEAIAKQGLPDEFTFGEPGAITINDNPAVRMNLTAGERGEGQLLLAIYNKKWLSGIILYAASGEGDKWDNIARDIVASVKFNVDAESTPEATGAPTLESTAEPLPLTQTAKTENGLASLSYPEAWFTRQSGEDMLYISNTKAGVEKSFDSKMVPGEVNILISVNATEDFINQARLPLKADASILEILQSTIKSVGSELKFSTPVVVTIGDKPAAIVNFSATDFEGTAWLIEYKKGALIAVQMLAAPGETLQWQPTALAIAQSVRSTD